jgi:hypothetical protein
MSERERISVRASHGSLTFYAKTALSLGVLLLSGILHATPITSVGESQLQNSKQLDSYRVVLIKKKEALDSAANTVLAPRLNVRTSWKAVTAGCIVASNCSNPVEVPEPQSLVLVGTGLLAMAGVIRRRLAH